MISQHCVLTCETCRFAVFSVSPTINTCSHYHTNGEGFSWCVLSVSINVNLTKYPSQYVKQLFLGYVRDVYKKSEK